MERKRTAGCELACGVLIEISRMRARLLPSMMACVISHANPVPPRFEQLTAQVSCCCASGAADAFSAGAALPFCATWLPVPEAGFPMAWPGPLTHGTSRALSPDCAMADPRPQTLTIRATNKEATNIPVRPPCCLARPGARKPNVYAMLEPTCTPKQRDQNRVTMGRLRINCELLSLPFQGSASHLSRRRTQPNYGAL